jgi:hypothetical protein
VRFAGLSSPRRHFVFDNPNDGSEDCAAIVSTEYQQSNQ